MSRRVKVADVDGDDLVKRWADLARVMAYRGPEIFAHVLELAERAYIKAKDEQDEQPPAVEAVHQ